VKKILLFSSIFFSPLLWAEHYYQQSWQFTPTLSYETNAIGSITNIGFKWGGDPDYSRHIELVSQLSVFHPASQFSDETTFTNLDASVRFGLFDQINAYAEVGIAVDELFVEGIERRYFYTDNDGYYYEDGYEHHSSRPDWFVGVGGGWRLDWLSVNVYGRYRYLESLEEAYLEHNVNPYQKIPSRYQWFTGVELSVHF
jgi:hypothetical protein